MDPRKNCAFEKLFTINAPHILEKIFFSLDYKSYATCLEVSKAWNELLTSESYKQKGKCMFHEEITEEAWDAVWNGNAEAVRGLLFSGMVDVNLKHSIYLEWTLLCTAAWKGHSHVAKLLLDAGADPNKERNDGATPLFCAAAEGHTDIVLLLLNAGADVDKANISGYTPLHQAITWDRTDVTELLLNRGADFNKADKWRRTPLHKATTSGYPYIVKLLLQCGADSTVTNMDGNTPLNLAIIWGRKEIINILSNVV